jgi:hypothetical protein
MEEALQAIQSIIMEDTMIDSPPSYFRIMFNNSCKRQFNSTRGKNNRLSSAQNFQQFLALNAKQLHDTLTNMFPGKTLTFFQDARMCADKGYAGVTMGGLLDAYTNWQEQGGRLQSVGFVVEVDAGNRVLILHVRVEVNLHIEETVSAMGGSGSIDISEQTITYVGGEFRNSYSRVSGLWPRETTGLPLPWSNTPSWIKQMIVAAYKTELERRKLTLNESIESDLQK